MIDSISQFIDVIRAAGLKPPSDIVPGEIHRFPGAGKNTANTAGWCILFDDGLGGSFGDLSTGLSENWFAKQEKTFNDIERAAFKRDVNRAQKLAAQKRLSKYDAAAAKAKKIWNLATPLENDHPYIIKKCLNEFCIRLNNDMVVKQYNGDIVLPIYDFSDELASLQFIKPDGSKRFLAGGRKRDCFIHTQNDLLVSPDYFPLQVIICEGWATGHTLACMNPYALVLVAIDAGNLKSLALYVSERWDDTTLIIAGDDDRQTPGNPGATNARAAALAYGALLSFPVWPADAPESLTDFNDLHVWYYNESRKRSPF